MLSLEDYKSLEETAYESAVSLYGRLAGRNERPVDPYERLAAALRRMIR